MLNHNKKFIYFGIFIFFILVIVGWLDVKKGYGRFSILSAYIPDGIKNVLKETIFIIPNLKNQLKIQNAKVEELSVERTKTLETWKDIISNNVNNISAKKISEEIIDINAEKLILSKFLLPIPSYTKWGQKSVGYIDKINNKFIFVTGDGNIFYFDGNNISKNIISKPVEEEIKLNLFKIKSNLSSLNDGLGEVGKISVKDILIKNNQIYIAHINEKKENCHNIEIINAEVNFDYLKFSNFFTYDECFLDANIHATGGRMVSFESNKILFTTGDGLKKFGRHSQNVNSFFGKILEIDINTKKHEMVSMGHRNPQGLFYDRENNIITSTEHGPAGGDEINIIKISKNKIPNYGWPISSYGVHEPDDIDRFKRQGLLAETLKEQPFHKSHSDYGFEEPIKYYSPSIGISEIIKMPSNLNKNFKDYYLVGSMGWNIEEFDKTLHYFKLNKEKNKIVKIGTTIIGERIRDLKYDKNNNIIIMILENSPSISFISLDDF
jgi:glucose/arabinose dehydrogenase